MPHLLKIQKLAGHGGDTNPLATQEAEAGESANRESQVPVSEIMPLHSSLKTETLSPKEKNFYPEGA